MAEEFEVYRVDSLPWVSGISDNDALLVVQGGRPKRVPPSLMKGKKGDPGDNTTLRYTGEWVQQRVGANGVWLNLVPVKDMTGPSAYELAVKNGYKGTEAEWLASLSKASEDAAKVALAAAKKAEDTNTSVTKAEQLRANAETFRVQAENLRVQSENLRKQAEDGRVSVEEVRVSEESKRVLAETIRNNAEGSRTTEEGKRKTAEENRVMIEQGRVTEEGKRITAEQGRVGAETLRAGEEVKRASAEGLREDEEAARAEVERLRKTAEQGRATEEGKRVSTETIRDTSEQARVAEEAKRAATEIVRVDLEKIRQADEQSRIAEEGKRGTAETTRKNAETERVGNEDKRKEAELLRVAEETDRSEEEAKRVTAEGKRVTVEAARVTEEGKRTTAENLRVQTEAARVEAEKKRVTAEALRVQESKTAVDNADIATEKANTAAASAQDTADHPTYIGENFYVYKWNKATKAYDKTDIFTKGDGFSIDKVYPSITAMNADKANIREGRFVLINTNDVENPDNARLYVKGSTDFEYLVDMSGAIGFTGKTPQFKVGNVTSGVEGSQASMSLSEGGTDVNGNPVYSINLSVPRGDKGKVPVISIGTITTIAPGGAASAQLVPNGMTDAGEPKYTLNMSIPKGDTGGLGSGDALNLTVSFTEATTRENIGSGEKMSVLFGKIKKFFSDLKTVAFTGKFSDLIDTPTTVDGYGITDASKTGHKHVKSEITDFPTSMPASDVSSWAKAATKPAYTYAEVGASPSNHNHTGVYQPVGSYASSSHTHEGVYEPVFTKNTAFNKNFGSTAGTVCEGNDGRLTNSRPASDVSSWAKAASKPAYTYSEVGALAAGGTAVNASRVANTFVLKVNSGTTEGTNLYTFNGSAGKTLDIKAGANVTLTAAAGILTIASTNTVYTHPSYTARASGLYKITVDAAGHVSTVANVVKTDITALGIPAQDTVYTHPSSTGNKHIPSGGVSGQILRWSADGTAAWGADYNTTYGVATQSANGLMSAADKKRLDFEYGRNDVTTLASLPVTKRTVNAALSGATSLSLAAALEEGQEMLIRCLPSVAFTQPIPNSGVWTSMSGASFTATANVPFEISIWCYKSGYYEVAILEQD